METHSEPQNTTHTLVDTQGQFRVANPPSGLFLGGRRKSENTEEAHEVTGRTCKRLPRQWPEPGSGLTQGPRSCEAPTLLGFFFFFFCFCIIMHKSTIIYNSVKHSGQFLLCNLQVVPKGIFFFLCGASKNQEKNKTCQCQWWPCYKSDSWLWSVPKMPKVNYPV